MDSTLIKKKQKEYKKIISNNKLSDKEKLDKITGIIQALLPQIPKNREWPWEEFNEKYPPRYEIKYGRFGAYFYDNKLKCDLDLDAILRNLNKLQLMEKCKE